jgi:hypothetical protein
MLRRAMIRTTFMRIDFVYPKLSNSYTRSTLVTLGEVRTDKTIVEDSDEQLSKTRTSKNLTLLGACKMPATGPLGCASFRKNFRSAFWNCLGRSSILRWRVFWRMGIAC